MEKELINKLKYLINKKKSLAEICQELELKDYELEQTASPVRNHITLVQRIQCMAV